jgi:hypothetical protein
MKTTTTKNKQTKLKTIQPRLLTEAIKASSKSLFLFYDESAI